MTGKYFYAGLARVRFVALLLLIINFLSSRPCYTYCLVVLPNEKASMSEPDAPSFSCHESSSRAPPILCFHLVLAAIVFH